jgi:acetyl esterase/lipase
VQQQQHIGVCGGLLGGGLAAMLALTECQKMGTSITSTYLSSPVLDWSFPGSVPVSTPSKTGTFKASKVSKATAPASSWDRISPSQALRPSDLLSARTALFRKLENTLDPFASPLLFLRTPLVSYNEEEAEDDAAEQETQHEKEREGRLHETQSVLRIARVPLHHRHHPPAHSGLQIPRVHIAVDPDSILYDQAWEFARLLRRSVMNSERGAGQRYLDDQREGQIDGKGGNDAVTEEARIEAEKRISFDEVGIEDAVKSMGKWAAGLSE